MNLISITKFLLSRIYESMKTNGIAESQHSCFGWVEVVIPNVHSALNPLHGAIYQSKGAMIARSVNFGRNA